METYAPIDTCQTLRVSMILSLIHGWASHQLDFVITFPQAPAEKPLYMTPPQGYHWKASPRTHMFSCSSEISMTIASGKSLEQVSG